jgi:predicted transcriptional regulator
MVHDKIRRKRKGLEIEQREIAKRIGICPAYLCQMENGKKPMTKEMASRILEAIEQAGK